MSEEGGGNAELVPGGKHISVTPCNVCEYVRLYALHRMYTSQLKALQNMKEGVMDVIPGMCNCSRLGSPKIGNLLSTLFFY